MAFQIFSRIFNGISLLAALALYLMGCSSPNITLPKGPLYLYESPLPVNVRFLQILSKVNVQKKEAQTLLSCTLPQMIEQWGREYFRPIGPNNTLRITVNHASIKESRIPIKSGFMVGLGENDDEVETAIKDLRNAGVSMLTIGQYLPPSSNHWSLERYVHPDVFERWKHFAMDLGFTNVASAPLVRSSYHAEAFVKM